MTGRYAVLLTMAATLQFFFAVPAFSQNPRIDSLQGLLKRYDLEKNAAGHASPTLADSVKVNLLDKLALAYSEVQPDKSRDAALAQLSLSNKIGFQLGRANALNTLGIYYEYKVDYRRSLASYEEALEIARKNGYEALELHILSNIALSFSMQGIYTEALKFHQQVLSKAKGEHRELNVLATYNNIGSIYKILKKNKEALAFYQKALNLQLRQKKPYHIAQTYSNIAQVYRLEKKYDLALSYLQKGLQSAVKENDLNAIANNYSGIGRVYADLKDYDRALENFLKAKALREETQNGYGICTSYMSLGDIYLQKGEHAKALDYTMKALEMIRGQKELEMHTEIYRQLTAIHEATGNYKQAYESLTMYKTLNDSIFNAENNKKLVEQQLNFDFKNIQEKKDLNAKQEGQRNENTRNFIIIISLLVVSFLIVLLFQRSKMARIRRQEALQAERNRINRDLHDNLGAQLSTARMYLSGIRDNGPAISETIDNTLGLLDDSIHELRRIMNDEDNTILQQQGFISVVSALATKVHHLHQIGFSLNHNFEGRLPDKIEHALYRMLQEMINNTLKYAEATNISIDLTQRDGKIIMFYEDDGKGFDAAHVKRGNGLANIEFRAEQLGGSAEIDSEPGHGARWIIEIPLNT